MTSRWQVTLIGLFIRVWQKLTSRDPRFNIGERNDCGLVGWVQNEPKNVTAQFSLPDVCTDINE